MPSIFPERIETDRLDLQRLSRDTIDPLELYEVCGNHERIEEITEYLTWSPHGTIKETIEFIDAAEADWDAAETATYLIRPRDGEDGAGEIAGTTGLSVEWDRRIARLGIWLRPRFWGRGYSGERADALVELAFERLDLEVIVVEHEDGNEQSRRAIEKYVEANGGRHEGLLRNSMVNDGEPVDQHRYTISREEYRDAASR